MSSSTYDGDYSGCYILKAPKGSMFVKFYYNGVSDGYSGLIPFYSDVLEFYVDNDIQYVDVIDVNGNDYYSTNGTIYVDTNT